MADTLATTVTETRRGEQLERELETPVPVVDLDRLERNLDGWQRYCDDAGLANRPHVKTHKSVEVARRQLALGAIGVTCQKLGEAEVMADAGFDDILIPYNLLGERKLERLAALLARVRMTVSVDHVRLLGGLARAADAAGRELRVQVELETGMKRAGVQTPAEAGELASAIARTPGLRFAGLMAYPTPPESRPRLEATITQLRSLGLDRGVVSGGGTPPMWQARELRPLVTEWRAGTYAYHDRNTIAAGAATVDDAALTVLATVVSRPTPDRAILDAGSKALTSDAGPTPSFGAILEAPASTIAALSEEHGHVSLGAGDSLEIGDLVHVLPNHVCPVSNLFDEVAVVRGGRVVDRWRVDARGRSQ